VRALPGGPRQLCPGQQGGGPCAEPPVHGLQEVALAEGRARRPDALWRPLCWHPLPARGLQERPPARQARHPPARSSSSRRWRRWRRSSSSTRARQQRQALRLPPALQAQPQVCRGLQVWRGVPRPAQAPGRGLQAGLLPVCTERQVHARGLRQGPRPVRGPGGEGGGGGGDQGPGAEEAQGGGQGAGDHLLWQVLGARLHQEALPQGRPAGAPQREPAQGGGGGQAQGQGARRGGGSQCRRLPPAHRSSSRR